MSRRVSNKLELEAGKVPIGRLAKTPGPLPRFARIARKWNSANSVARIGRKWNSANSVARIARKLSSAGNLQRFALSRDNGIGVRHEIATPSPRLPVGEEGLPLAMIKTINRRQQGMEQALVVSLSLVSTGCGLCPSFGVTASFVSRLRISSSPRVTRSEILTCFSSYRDNQRLIISSYMVNRFRPLSSYGTMFQWQKLLLVKIFHLKVNYFMCVFIVVRSGCQQI